MDDGVYDPIRIDKVTVTYLNGRSAAVDAMGVDTFSWYICLQIFLPVI